MNGARDGVTEAEKLAWLRARRGHQVELPTGPRTAEGWRKLIFDQMRCDRSKTTGILDVGVWTMITSIDLDVIEDIICRIAVYGVLEEPDEGGSGPNEEVPRAGDDVQGEGDCRTC
jgi:hypothetical protein